MNIIVLSRMLLTIDALQKHYVVHTSPFLACTAGRRGSRSRLVLPLGSHMHTRKLCNQGAYTLLFSLHCADNVVTFVQVYVLPSLVGSQRYVFRRLALNAWPRNTES